MSFAFSQQIFLTNILSSSTQKPTRTTLLNSSSNFVSSKHEFSPDIQNDNPNGIKKNQFAKLAIITLAAGVLTLGSVHDASAAKTGGRVGGQAFRPSAPRSSSPRINNNSRTNIYINPPVAPPLVGGYGFGYGVPYYGGWGWSPFSFFAPGPSVAVGIGGGFDLLFLFIFLGTIAAVVRRLFGSRVDDDDDY